MRHAILAVAERDSLHPDGSKNWLGLQSWSLVRIGGNDDKTTQTFGGNGADWGVAFLVIPGNKPRSIPKTDLDRIENGGLDRGGSGGLDPRSD